MYPLEPGDTGQVYNLDLQELKGTQLVNIMWYLGWDSVNIKHFVSMKQQIACSQQEKLQNLRKP